jgi:hypothetical protein
MGKVIQNFARNRNFGCRITVDIFFGNIPAVVLENEYIRMTILAGRGADVVEFLYKPLDIDLVWLTNKGIPTKKIPEFHDDDVDTFLEGYPGGWQTVFPNGGAPSEVGGISFGQHAEAALLEWQYVVNVDTAEEVSVDFMVETKKTPFRVKKQFSLKRYEKKCKIVETIHNLSDKSWKTMWGAHFSFGAPLIDSNSTIALPKGGRVIPHPESISSAGRRLADLSEFNWPMGKSSSGAEIDFSNLPPVKTASEMLYIKNLTESWYQINSPSKKLAAKVSWDRNIFPYLWFWQEFGAANDYPWYGKHYNIGLEPFSSYPTNGLAGAIANGSALSFNPKEIKSSQIDFEVIAL